MEPEKAVKYYGKSDIVAAYDITESKLLYKIRTGKIKARKLTRDGRAYWYIVPETELWKLESLKKRDPVFYPSLQPGYIDEFGRRYYIDDEVPGKKPKYVDYGDYIHSEQWQSVRRRRLQLDGYQCQRCGTGTNLVVHHISYAHLGQPGEVEDLVTLCKACHSEVHEEDIRKRGLYEI